MRRALGLLSVCAALGCGDDDGGGGEMTSIPPECNPLGGPACMLPYPSSAFLAEDATSATGFRVDVPGEAAPANIDGERFDVTLLNKHDGFSPNAVIVVAFPTGVSGEGFAAPEALDEWTSAAAPVALIDMEDFSRPPFFAEPDLNHVDPTLRALLVRPALRLRPGHRYAVVVRKAVKAADGSDLPVPEGFQALLDGRTLDHPLWARVANRHQAVMGAVAQAGIAADDVVLAWDFVTASDEFLTRDLRTMRERGMAMIEAGATNLTFEAQELPVSNPSIALRYVVGTYDAPSFLTDGARESSVMARDGDDLPVASAMVRYNFAAVIPRCVETAPGPKPLLLFGHGLFGTAADYLDGGLLQRVANETCMVIVGGDFIGLSTPDTVTAIKAVTNLNNGKALIEKLPQGIINFMTLARIARGPFRTSPLFMVGGESVIDADRIFYFGASLGGIMGGVLMAYETDIEIGALGVPGANWTMLFERSLAWPALRTAMQNNYPVPYDYALNQALMGTFWDRYDPITTAPYLVSGSSELGLTPKKIFAYAAVNDSLVTRHTTEMLVRTMGIPITMPSVYVPWGVAEATNPVTSGFTIYDEHAEPAPPYGNLAPEEDSGTHSDVHERAAIHRQLTRLLDEAMLFHECKVSTTLMPCDCATGACD